MFEQESEGLECLLVKPDFAALLEELTGTRVRFEDTEANTFRRCGVHASRLESWSLPCALKARRRSHKPHGGEPRVWSMGTSAIPRLTCIRLVAPRAFGAATAVAKVSQD